MREMQEGGIEEECRHWANTHPGTKPIKTPVLSGSEVIKWNIYWIFFYFFVNGFPAVKSDGLFHGRLVLSLQCSLVIQYFTASLESGGLLSHISGLIPLLCIIKQMLKM